MKNWTFITKHGLVFLYISQNPQCTTRDIANAINTTERTVHRALVDMEAEGYVTHLRTGRGNIYQIDTDIALKNGLTRNSVTGDLLGLLDGKRKGKRRDLSKGEG